MQEYHRRENYRQWFKKSRPFLAHFIQMTLEERSQVDHDKYLGKLGWLQIKETQIDPPGTAVYNLADTGYEHQEQESVGSH